MDIFAMFLDLALLALLLYSLFVSWELRDSKAKYSKARVQIQQLIREIQQLKPQVERYGEAELNSRLGRQEWLGERYTLQRAYDESQKQIGELLGKIHSLNEWIARSRLEGLENQGNTYAIDERGFITNPERWRDPDRFL